MLFIAFLVWNELFLILAKLQEKFNIIDVKLAAIERQNGTGHRDNRLQKQINGSTGKYNIFLLNMSKSLVIFKYVNIKHSGVLKGEYE